ncbi:MAG TPA: hypothetical protein VGG64_18690 [Pirellulales bacterium]|jgi:hypothetical protein
MDNKPRAGQRGIPEWTRQTAIEELPEDLRPKFKKLKKIFDERWKISLHSYYTIGEILRDCRIETEALGKRFRLISQMQFLADALTVEIQQLRTPQRLAHTYSEAEYRSLVQHPEITWGHILHLISVPIAAERDKLAACTIAEKWSPHRLRNEILGRPAADNAQRTPKPPRSVKAGFEQAIRMAKSLSSIFDRAFFSDTYDLTTRILEMSPDDVTAGTEQQVREAIETLAHLSQTAGENSRRLLEALVWIEMVLKLRNSMPGIAGQLDIDQ